MEPDPPVIRNSLSSPAQPWSGVLLDWYSIAEKVYRVEVSSDARAPYWTVADDGRIGATPPRNTFVHEAPAAAPARFYRIVMEP